MAITVQFVSSISATPTVLLDLNAEPFYIGKGELDLSPPELREVSVSSMLADGERIPASAYNNRVLSLPLQLGASSTAVAGDYLTLLMRELNKPVNIIKIQIGAVPVFLRTLRVSSKKLSMVRLNLPRLGKYVLEIPCEPFALGLEETISPAVISQNPATNGYVDINSVLGEVETPLLVRATNVTGMSTLVATRRHGIPSNGLYYKQAETMSLGPGAAIGSNQSGYSGSGSNNVTVSVGSGATVTALSDNFPSASMTTVQATEARGRYRLFAAIKPRTGGVSVDPVDGTLSGIKIQAKIAGMYYNPESSHRWHPETQLVDLGSFNIPTGNPGARGGYGAVQTVGPTYIQILVRNSGLATQTVTFDYFLFWPEDEEICEVSWPTGPASDWQIYDACNDDVYWMTTTGVVLSALNQGFPARTGKLPMVAPGAPNRVFFTKKIRNSDVSGYIYPTGTGMLPDTTLNISYWPRYLNLFPNNSVPVTPPPSGAGYGAGLYSAGLYGAI